MRFLSLPAGIGQASRASISAMSSFILRAHWPASRWNGEDAPASRNVLDRKALKDLELGQLGFPWIDLEWWHVRDSYRFTSVAAWTSVVRLIIDAPAVVRRRRTRDCNGMQGRQMDRPVRGG